MRGGGEVKFSGRFSQVRAEKIERIMKRHRCKTVGEAVYLLVDMYDEGRMEVADDTAARMAEIAEAFALVADRIDGNRERERGEIAVAVSAILKAEMATYQGELEALRKTVAGGIDQDSRTRIESTHKMMNDLIGWVNKVSPKINETATTAGKIQASIEEAKQAAAAERPGLIKRLLAKPGEFD